MNKKEIDRCMKAYLSARAEGKDPYFDVEELLRLLDSLEATDDRGYYKDIVELGLRLHPGSEALLLKRCHVMIDEDRLEEALDVMDSLSNQDCDEVHVLRLECYCLQQDATQVTRYLENLERRNYSNLQVIYEYISSYCNDNLELEETEKIIKHGLELYPEDEELMRELGNVYEDEGRYREAVTIYNKLIDKAPYSYDNWLALGRIQMEGGDFSQAIDAFEFASTCENRRDTEMMMMKAYCYIKIGNEDRALGILNVLKNVRRHTPYALSLMGECYVNKGEFPKAYKTLKTVLENYADLLGAEPWVNMITCCFEMERNHEAVDYIEMGQKRFPRDLGIFSTMLMGVAEMEKFEELDLLSETFYQLIEEEVPLEVTPKEAALKLIGVGMACHYVKDLKRALNYYERALKVFPGMIEARCYAALAYLMQENMAQAREHLKYVPKEIMRKLMLHTGTDAAFVDEALDEAYQNLEKDPVHKDLVNNFLKNNINKN